MIVFMGVAGAGKSVQGKLLADDLGYRWLSTGEFLRMHISGERRQEMLSGKLLGDQEIINILEKFFVEAGVDEACVLDGFPRTLPQAKWLIEKHDSKEINIQAVIHIQASKEVVKARLLSRGRQDDHETAINQRFHEYEQQTLPIVQWFKKDNIPVFEVDGERPIEVIHQEIMRLIR